MEKVPEYFERAWSQALLAVSTAEDEASKMVAKVAGAAGWGQDEVKRQVRELTDRLTSQRQALERNVEDGVRRALLNVRVPRRDDLREIGARLERLEQRLQALTERR
jgi:polyhydroxyalkanoate synthesis regulator phasin